MKSVAKKAGILVLLAIGVGCADAELENPTEAETPVGDATIIVDPPNSMDTMERPDEIDPVDDCDDTLRLSNVETGHLAPSSRIVSMRVPNTPQDALDMDCIAIPGSNGGLGLATLLHTLGVNLDDIVKPNADGQIASIILGHISGWQPGETANETEGLNLHMYNGHQIDPVTFRIARDSDESAPVMFPASVSCQELETRGRNLTFDLPVEGGGVLPFVLEHVQVSGQVSISGEGFSLNKGTIIGYISETAIVKIVQDIQDGCREHPEEPTCADLSFLLSNDAESITSAIVLPFLHGLDAQLIPQNTSVQSCTGTECNAMSICIRFESEPVTVLQAG